MRISWLAVALAVTCLSPMAMAQIGSSPAPAPSGPGVPTTSADPHTARLQSALAQLNLSADQKAKIQQILTNSSLEGRQRREAIRAVLTPEQQQQLEQLMPHGHHRGGGGFQGGSSQNSSP